jgi:membrane protease subunit HflK
MADAEGEASRFVQLLTEYEKAPGVTRDRLYIETIESVYGNSNIVLLDAAGSGNLVYLPIDKLLEQKGGSGSGGSKNLNNTSESSAAQSDVARQQADDLRVRRGR